MRLTTATLAAALAAAPVAAAPVAAQPAPAARVDSIFAFATDSSPGCAVAAVRDGRTLYAQGYGVADLEHAAPITARTPFYLASVSKQFTAAAINLLAADGALSLDDDVRRWVPELPGYGAPITVRQLMHHTSGLRDYLSLFSLADLEDFPITNGDFLAMMRRQRGLNFAPGTQYSYSNSGYVLLAVIVERVTGKTLRRFAAERLFAPLGMTGTAFRDRHTALVSGRAVGYEWGGGGWALSVPYFDVVGDGGLYSTVEDLAKWEGRRPTPLDTVRGRLADGTPLGYGAGLMYGAYRGDSVVEHGGSYGGYNTHLLRFPRRRFSVAVLCNGTQAPAQLLAQKVADVFLGDVLAPRTPPAPTVARAAAAESPERWAGVYLDERTMTVRRLVARDGVLRYVRGPGNESELVPIGGGRFAMRGTGVVVALSATGDTMRVVADGVVAPPPTFRRVPPPAARDLREYAGAYASAELNVAWAVAARDSTLVVQPARGDPVRVRQAFDDGFVLGALLARFTRDSTGRVNGILVSAGERARNVRFERQR